MHYFLLHSACFIIRIRIYCCQCLFPDGFVAANSLFPDGFVAANSLFRDAFVAAMHYFPILYNCCCQSVLRSRAAFFKAAQAGYSKKAKKKLLLHCIELTKCSVQFTIGHVQLQAPATALVCREPT